MPFAMRLAAALGLLATVSACGIMPIRLGGTAEPPPVPAPDAPPKERLITAIEGQGCVLTAANRDAVLAAANLGLADLATLVPELNAEGRAEASGEGAIRILSDRCI